MSAIGRFITSMPDSTSSSIGLGPDYKDFPATQKIDGLPLVTTSEDGRVRSEEGTLLHRLWGNRLEDRRRVPHNAGSA